MTTLAHPASPSSAADAGQLGNAAGAESSAARPSVADRVYAALASNGVQLVMGFPGETSLPLYLAAQRQKNVRHVLARCPRCAAYMAEAYARISGGVGVCDAPGGIGSPFVTPALLEAANSSTPLLFMASGVARRSRGRWTTGECDQQALFDAVTKAAHRFESTDDVDDRIAGALRAALTPRSGPVFLEFPADILVAATSTSHSSPDVDAPSVAWQLPTPAPSRRDMRTIAEVVRQARQVVIVAGGGVHRHGVDALRKLAELTRLPVATTLNGKGAVDERAPYALGVCGAKGSAAANEYIEAADCVIAVGTKLGDKSTDKYRWPHGGQTVVHVDTDGTELARWGRSTLPILADAGEFFTSLAHELAGFGYAGPAFVASPGHWDDGLAAQICRRLSGDLGDDDLVIADASVSSGWAGAVLQLRGARQRLLTPRGSGSIGYALPASLGAQLARPKARVFAIGGDGGFAMAMHEMETATRLRLPVTYFLLNNQRLGLIDRHAVDLNGGAAVSAEFQAIDWQAAARAFGWRALRVSDMEQLDASWSLATDGTTPTLVECQVPPSENAPDFVITRDGDHRP